MASSCNRKYIPDIISVKGKNGYLIKPNFASRKEAEKIRSCRTLLKTIQWLNCALVHFLDGKAAMHKSTFGHLAFIASHKRLYLKCTICTVYSFLFFVLQKDAFGILKASITTILADGTDLNIFEAEISRLLGLFTIIIVLGNHRLDTSCIPKPIIGCFSHIPDIFPTFSVERSVPCMFNITTCWIS